MVSEGAQVRPFQPRVAARRLTSGDVVKASVRDGRVAYLQYTCPGWHAPVVRVLPGLFDKPVDGERLRALVAGASLFRTQFRVDEWHKAVVVNLPVPVQEADLPPFRFTSASPRPSHRGSVKEPDGETVDDFEFLARHPDRAIEDLPLWDIPFAGTLVWMIEDQWTPRCVRGMVLGLKPRADEPEAPPPRPPAKPRVVYRLSFPDQLAAMGAVGRLHKLGLLADDVYDEVSESWMVYAAHDDVHPRADIEAAVQSVADELGGRFEGTLRGPLA